jgi:hypothetical protein
MKREVAGHVGANLRRNGLINYYHLNEEQSERSLVLCIGGTHPLAATAANEEDLFVQKNMRFGLDIMT